MLQEQNRVLSQTNEVLTQQNASLETHLDQAHVDMERLQAQKFEVCCLRVLLNSVFQMYSVRTFCLPQQ